MEFVYLTEGFVIVECLFVVVVVLASVMDVTMVWSCVFAWIINSLHDEMEKVEF